MEPCWTHLRQPFCCSQAYRTKYMYMYSGRRPLTTLEQVLQNYGRQGLGRICLSALEVDSISRIALPAMFAFIKNFKRIWWVLGWRWILHFGVGPVVWSLAKNIIRMCELMLTRHKQNQGKKISQERFWLRLGLCRGAERFDKGTLIILNLNFL